MWQPERAGTVCWQSALATLLGRLSVTGMLNHLWYCNCHKESASLRPWKTPDSATKHSVRHYLAVCCVCVENYRLKSVNDLETYRYEPVYKRLLERRMCVLLVLLKKLMKEIVMARACFVINLYLHGGSTVTFDSRRNIRTSCGGKHVPS